MRHDRIPSGDVTIALPTSLVSTIVPPLLNELREERPGIRLRVLEGFGDQVSRWVADGTTAIGIYGRYFEAFSTNTASKYLSRIMLVTPKAQANLVGEIELAELKNFELILPMHPNALRVCLDVNARRQNISLNVVAEAVSFLAQMEIAQQCGYSFLAERNAFMQRQLDKRFNANVIKNPYFHRAIILSTSQSIPLTHASRDVVERVAKLLKKLRFDVELT
ncbi:LysR substrate-binding domain-containing protein [Ochrobactrum teleogrylli]